MTTLIFVHIPKVAGSTVNSIIQRMYPADEIYSFHTPHDGALERLQAMPKDQKRKFRVIKGHIGFGLDEILPQPSTYFTMLRDPIERVISDYYYVRRTPIHPFHQTIIANNLSLDAYIRSGMSKVASDNGQTRFVGGGPKGASHIPFGKLTRDILECAKENLSKKCAAVGLVEQFDESMLLAQHTFGWTTPWYQKKNVTKNRIMADALDAATLNLIRENNQLDMELHAFAKQLFVQQLRAAPRTFHARVSAFKVLNSNDSLRSIYFEIINRTRKTTR
ncbi:MAG: hypothetical protein HDKAJFGB_02736 [Anaerolineae bacterium]|nr:hypothetical protein [Anaerolineae bacterium]